MSISIRLGQKLVMFAVPLLAISSTVPSKSKAVIDQLATQLQTWWSGQLMRFPCKTSVRQKHFSWAQFFSCSLVGFPIKTHLRFSDRINGLTEAMKNALERRIQHVRKFQNLSKAKILQEVSWGWGVGLVVGTFVFCLRGLGFSSCSNRFFSSLVVYS